MQGLGGNADLVALAFPNAHVGYVADNGGTVYRTRNGGRSWRVVLRMANPWGSMCLAFPEELFGFAGADNHLYHTDDGGETWISLSTQSPSMPHHQQVRRSPGVFGENKDEQSELIFLLLGRMILPTKEHGFATNVPGLLETEDGGETWSVIDLGGDEAVLALCTVGKYLWCTRGDGAIGQYHMESKSLRLFGPAKMDSLMSIAFACENVGAAVGVCGSVVVTHDAGQSWHVSTPVGYPMLECVAFFSEAIGLVVGSGGAMLRTGDCGRSWTPAAMPEALDLYDIAVVSATTAYIACSSRTLLRTTDSGLTFHFVVFRPDEGAGVEFW